MKHRLDILTRLDNWLETQKPTARLAVILAALCAYWFTFGAFVGWRCL